MDAEAMLMDGVPMGGDMPMDMLLSGMMGGMDMGPQLLIRLAIMALVLGLVSLIIFPARANWRKNQERVGVVEYVGFWRRIAIGIVDLVVSVAIVPIFLNIAFYFRDGQTIGDKIYGAKLVDKMSYGTASVGQLLVRVLSKQFSKAAFGLGFWAAGWRKEKLAWHDGLADVRYVSYKKVHGFWTWFPFLVLFVLPILITIVIGTMSGYEEASMQAAAEMGM